jgi:opacity protein-like surface antigen
MRRILLCLGTIAFAATTLLAQESPKVEVFGGYSYLNADQEGFVDRQHFHGFDTNATFYINPHVGIEGDFAGQFQSDCLGVSSLLGDSGLPGVGCHYLQFMAGPKVAFKTGRLTSFGHVLFGGNDVVISTSVLDTTVSVSQTRWAMAAGGGVDWAISPRYSVRLGQADYLLTNHSTEFGGTHQNNIRISAGIVFKFGVRGEAATDQQASRTASPVPTRGRTTSGPAEVPELGLTVREESGEPGVRVLSVNPGGPAATAGLVMHDRIVSVNGSNVASVAELKNAISGSKDRKLTIRYMYLGTPQYRTVEVSY